MSGPSTKPASGRSWLRGNSAIDLSTPLILVGIMLLVALLARLRGDMVFDRVVTVMFINLLLTVGLQMFMGNSGLGDFGEYAFVTIGAYASIWFSLDSQQKSLALPDMPKTWWIYGQHWPFPAAVAAAVLFATAFGALVGIALVRLRGASFTIATFALLIVVNRVALQWKEVTRGARTVLGIPQYTTLAVAVGCACAIVVIAYFFKESAVGLKLRAAREDEAAAASIGINAAFNRWIGWVLSAAVGGLGGALWAHFIQQFSPTNFYLKETFLVVAMLIIGGMGSVSGAVIGAIVVALGQEQLRQLENWINLSVLGSSGGGGFELRGFADVILAVAIIVVLIRWPSGITRGRELTLGSFRRRPRRTQPEAAAGQLEPGASRAGDPTPV